MNLTRTTIHRRLSAFVDWIAPDQDNERELRAQANRIRDRIKAQARKDDLTVRSTPSAGSLAKRTGIRRHMAGNSEVQGFDIDVPFVVAPKTKEQEELTELLRRFETYARAAYPKNDIKPTKSSICIWFSNTNCGYDLVPMLDGEADETQILIRSTGERLETSVQKHVRFIRSRNQSSNASAGRVQFNQCVRLIKWWRCFQQQDRFLEVPSIVIDLLCAHLYDQYGVKETYEATLALWFAAAADLIQRRQRIAFPDVSDIPEVDPLATWEVLDPVTPTNNVTAKWGAYKVDELASWFAEGRDVWNRAIRSDLLGDDSNSLHHLVVLFGSPFKHHCGGDQ